jgi:hypothetical protein
MRELTVFGEMPTNILPRDVLGMLPQPQTTDVPTIVIIREVLTILN